jgi:imidazolonepropionase-like amidohydrolase
MERPSRPSFTTPEQVGLAIFAAAVGLGIAAIIHAGTLASIALVAAIGILSGFVLAARQRARR